MSAKTIEQVTEELSRPFAATEVKWKPSMVKGNRALALAYVDARVIQDRLDDVLGVMGWSDSYKVLDGGAVMCRLRLRIGEHWITKMDVGGQSEQPDDGDKMKAAFSDALKRTAVKFGVGRYLYRLPSQWVDYDPQKRAFARPPQLPEWAVSKGQAPAPKPAPQKAAARTTKPAPILQRYATEPPPDGAEFLLFADAMDRNLAKAGRCHAKELLGEVACAAEGWPDDWRVWDADQARMGWEVVKKFCAAHPAPAKAS